MEGGRGGKMSGSESGGKRAVSSDYEGQSKAAFLEEASPMERRDSSVLPPWRARVVRVGGEGPRGGKRREGGVRGGLVACPHDWGREEWSFPWTRR